MHIADYARSTFLRVVGLISRRLSGSVLMLADRPTTLVAA
jgi:hypothetical protein